MELTVPKDKNLARTISSTLSTSRSMALVLTMIVLLGAMTAPFTRPAPAGIRTDAETYRVMVDRLRAGDSYYVAVGDELRRGMYATVELFNWRTPLLMTTLAYLDERTARATLILATAACAIWMMGLAARRRETVTFTAALLLSGSLMIGIAIPSAIFFGEIWAGVFLGLSACAYLARCRVAGIGFALVGLFVRELAAVFCVIAFVLAVSGRRWSEVRIWLRGGLCYAVYYGIHVAQVFAHRRPDDVSGASWLQFGGWSFVLETVRWNGVLHFVPSALIVGMTVSICAILWQRSSPLEIRIGALAYLVFFYVAGKDFNVYWGWMTAPVWMIAASLGAQEISTRLATSLRFEAVAFWRKREAASGA